MCYVLAAAEDLVRIMDGIAARKQLARQLDGASYRIFFYRPRIEGLFSDTRVAPDTGTTHWRTIARNKVTAPYGLDALSRTSDPEDPRELFPRRIGRDSDTEDNLPLCDYIAKYSADIDLIAAHEANRTKASKPCRATSRPSATAMFSPISATGPPTETTRHCRGITHRSSRSLCPIVLGHCGLDPFSNHRAGFNIRTSRRVHRVPFFNNFLNEEIGTGANETVAFAAGAVVTVARRLSRPASNRREDRIMVALGAGTGAQTDTMILQDAT
jgi:hypothetical protein